MADIKTITVHGQGSINPSKIEMFMKELSLPYTTIPYHDFKVIKSPPFTDINPNGRVPVIEDPNTGLTLWESGAIIEYLLDTYDKKHVLGFEPGSHESYLAKQWLYFQVSGQGPYYGQAAWFKKFHPEFIPSAYERYCKEIVRVTGVLDTQLKREKEKMAAGSDGPWLVGGRFSYADLAFVSWQKIVFMVVPQEDIDFSPFEEYQKWIGKMLERPSVSEVLNSQRRR
ncbi:glutathione S-transferase Ure2-like protein [Polyplosphaeria fusca]|uniref:Glutathione S-transferase Ure2-like protein n=1 Tax=Polyplosphaeria fusca TaxID=682080 RepID=A0A9P4QVL1_9PLEO|nr:glutathione S-transferase Ure2-like protein [Polyplosphaeria fusca]